MTNRFSNNNLTNGGRRADRPPNPPIPASREVQPLTAGLVASVLNLNPTVDPATSSATEPAEDVVVVLSAPTCVLAEACNWVPSNIAGCRAEATSEPQ